MIQFSGLVDGQVEKVGMVALHKGRVRFIGFRRAGSLLATLKEGFRIDGEMLTPVNGKAYLEALPKRYRGDYLWAEDRA